MNYAAAIKALRQTAGLSKRRLATLAGVHATYITHIESGKKKPSLDVLEQLAQALGVKMSRVVRLAEED